MRHCDSENGSYDCVLRAGHRGSHESEIGLSWLNVTEPSPVPAGTERALRQATVRGALQEHRLDAHGAISCSCGAWERHRATHDQHVAESILAALAAVVSSSPATPEHNHGAHSVKAMGCPACDAHYRAPSTLPAETREGRERQWAQAMYGTFDRWTFAGTVGAERRATVARLMALADTEVALALAASPAVSLPGEEGPIPGEQPGGQER